MFFKKEKYPSAFTNENCVFYFKVNIKCFKTNIQKFAKYFFIAEPLLLFLADRVSSIFPTGVNYYAVGIFRDAFTAAEHLSDPCVPVFYSKTRC